MATFSPEIAAAAAQVNKEQLGQKERVHAVAKLLNVRASELLPMLEEVGVTGKKVASMVTKEQVELLLDAAASAGEKDATPKTQKKAAKKTAKKATAKKAAAKKTAAKKTAVKKTAAKKTQKKAAKKTAQEETAQESVDAPATDNVDVKTQGQEQSAGQEAQKVDEAPVFKAPEEKAPEEKASEEAQEKGQPAAKKTTRKRVVRRRAATPAKNAQPKNAEAKNAEPKNAEQDNAEPSNAEPTNAEPTNNEQQASERKTTPRRRVRRVVRRIGAAAAESAPGATPESAAHETSEATSAEADKADKADNNSNRKDRRNKQASRNKQQSAGSDRHGERHGERHSEPHDADQHDDQKPDQLHPAERNESDLVEEPVRLKRSTRLESQRKWRAENRSQKRTVSRSEFLARRESVERQMVVRDSHRSDHAGLTTQVGVVEDGMLVEHFVTSETQQSTVGNIYLGRVQNVLASMEAAFIDIGTGRNAVLYAGEMNWHSEHLHSKNRKMEQALRAGDYILVQVLKDPLGHKGARLTNRISFAGRYLVYFPGGTTAGISRKLPEGERRRLKDILSRVIPEPGGAIIRTAAENVTEEQISDDVNRLHALWENLVREEKSARNVKNGKPVALYEEPNMLVKVVRDLFNEDFTELLVDGDKSWKVVRDYVGRLAPELKKRVHKWNPDQHDGDDVFAALHLDEQLTKALARKVWLPSGGYLIIERTEAMTVIDVNTGSFIGRGGDLEETLTQNNLEAAEEIVRQMRLRDIGGMIVVDFIDMVLEENQDLVLRRLTEYLGRDRTHHKVSEVTSLGLVQITRKRQGTGLLETFSTVCEVCDGRGIIIHADPVEHEDEEPRPRRDHGGRKERQQARKQADLQAEKKQEAAENKPEHKSENKAENKAGNKPEESASRGGQDNRRSRNRRGRGGAKKNQSVQDIAATAVKQADQLDPEEPSGADYVPKEQRQGAQNNERKTSEQGTNEQRTSEQRTSEQRTSEQRTNGRRRVRRVVRRQTSPSTAQKDSQKAQRSQEQRSEAPTQDTPAQSFDEAKQEFDRSPRRRRRTRGNSRSDVAPRPENFSSTERSEQQEPAQSKPQGSGRRRPRRVVRRSN